MPSPLRMATTGCQDFADAPAQRFSLSLVWRFMWPSRQHAARVERWLALALGLALTLGLALGGTALAQPIGPALQRPAQTTQLGARAVLQAAARAGAALVAVGERGLILRSVDQAQTWQQAPSPVSVGLTALRFHDAQHGIAVGHGGVVLRTQDGGQHWTRVLDGQRLAQIEREAAQASGNATALQTAERLAADGPDKPWLDTLMLDAQRWLVVGAYGLAFYTADAGQHWQSWRQRLDNPKELHLYALRQRGAELLLAGEQGLLLHSRDGGQSFQRLSTPYKGSFFSAELLPDGSWVIAGLRGQVWRSGDAGASWQALACPVPANITSTALLPGGELLLGSQAGVILRADLAAKALHPLPLPPLPALNAVLPLEGGGLLALSVQGVQRLSGITSAPTPALPASQP